MLELIKKGLARPTRVPNYLQLRAREMLTVRRVRRGEQTFFRYQGALYPGHLHGGNARAFVTDRALTYCRGTGIDVGADRWPFPGATPIQNEPHRNAYRLDEFAEGSLDYVFSSHCLEHLNCWQEALDLWISKLKPGGVLFLYLPHESMRLWNPGSPWVGDAHQWQPRHEVLTPFLEAHRMEIVDLNTGRDDYWSFHVVSRRRELPRND